MPRFELERLGRCDFLDVLEEAVLLRREVTIDLADGSTFTDRLSDVVTEDGVDWAVFRVHPRVRVLEISSLER